MFVFCYLAVSVFSWIASAEGLLVEDSCGMTMDNSSQKQKHFDYVILGHDFDELPVLLLNWGAWDLLWLIDHPTEKELFERNYEKLTAEIEAGVFFSRFNNETTALHVVIINFDGLKLSQILSSAVNKLMLQLFMKFQRNLANLAYGFIVNANPVADQVINMAKPLVGNLLEHYEVYGTNSKHWIPKLIKNIPANQLPPALGGNNEYEPVETCNLI